MEDLRALFGSGLLAPPCALGVTLARPDAGKPRPACAVILRGADGAAALEHDGGAAPAGDASWTDEGLLCHWVTKLAGQQGYAARLEQAFRFAATFVCIFAVEPVPEPH